MSVTVMARVILESMTRESVSGAGEDKNKNEEVEGIESPAEEAGENGVAGVSIPRLEAAVRAWDPLSGNGLARNSGRDKIEFVSKIDKSGVRIARGEGLSNLIEKRK